ncbi:hypothetical protein AAK894_14485 [Lachnospiraceae bacterium 46-61]
MSVYQFLASDAMLETVENDKVFFFSIKEAREKGLSFPFDEKVLSRIDENEENTVLYFEKKEDLGEIDIYLEVNEYLAIYSMDYTKKKYRYTLDWSYTEERAEQLIDYIKRNLEKTKEIELWSIWLGEEQKQSIKNCKLCELNSKKIKEVLKSEQNSVALCLRVIK